MIFNKIKRLFCSYPIQTFTYFIPAPPERKHGYREKSFDRLIKKLTQMDFKITDIKTQSFNEQSKSGMWVVVSLEPLSKKANELAVCNFPNDNEDQEDNKALEHGDISQNLAHFSTKNDNLQGNLKGIDLPKDHSLKDNDNDNKDEIEGIYYID